MQVLKNATSVQTDPKQRPVGIQPIEQFIAEYSNAHAK